MTDASLTQVSRKALVAALVTVTLGASALPVLAKERSDPAFRLEDVTDSHLPDSPLRNSMDVGVADLNGDGDPDLVVPQEFLKNKLLLNAGDGRFTDASDHLPPLDPAELAGGPPQLSGPLAGHDSEDVSIVDLDGDGVLDLVIVSEDDIRLGRAPVHERYRGLGGGRFERIPGLPDTEADAVAHGDVDGDGDPDIVVAGAGQDRLLINHGGVLTDETEARLPREAAVTQDLELADLDGDGDLDAVLGQEGGHALWLNDGSGRFLDASDRLPRSGNVEARKVTPADIDGDGDLDLYFSHVGWQGRTPQDLLLINDGSARFVDETADRIPEETGTTLVARFADLDGDGDLDLVRGEVGPVTVWSNDGHGRFVDVSDQVMADRAPGVNIALALHDFDGDGRIDLYLGQLRAGNPDPAIRDRLFLNRVG